mmetsp:Transcript_9128/g.25533  ORF Transcript_9128/g.25533 Transcript_9128/m.25533 type:complete len:326 (-) Transcript_9128:1565-2542(-)
MQRSNQRIPPLFYILNGWCSLRKHTTVDVICDWEACKLMGVGQQCPEANRCTVDHHVCFGAILASKLLQLGRIQLDPAVGAHLEGHDGVAGLAYTQRRARLHWPIADVNVRRMHHPENAAAQAALQARLRQLRLGRSCGAVPVREGLEEPLEAEACQSEVLVRGQKGLGRPGRDQPRVAARAVEVEQRDRQALAHGRPLLRTVGHRLRPLAIAGPRRVAVADLPLQRLGLIGIAREPRHLRGGSHGSADVVVALQGVGVVEPAACADLGAARVRAARLIGVLLVTPHLLVGLRRSTPFACIDVEVGTVQLRCVYICKIIQKCVFA